MEMDLEMISRLLDEISVNTFEAGTWLWVDVVHVNNPHSFYVRPRSYSKYLPLLQVKGDHPAASDINTGDVFIFKSKLHKCCVRGKIISCKKNGEDVLYHLFAIDFGCSETDIPLNKIWTTNYPLQVPPLVSHCQLADCAPLGETWDYDTIDAMRNYVKGERAKMTIRSKTPENIIVELINSCPDDIATMLALTNYSTFGYANNAVNRFDSPPMVPQYYAQKHLQVGEVLHVRMQSGTLLEQFYVIQVQDYQLYLTDRNNYTSYAKLQNDIAMEDLKLNAPIGVYNDKNNKFERGLIKELLPYFNRAKVQLVDWGTVIEQSVLRMKAVPDWYLRVPVRAMWCTLHHNQSFSNNIASFSYPGAEFEITVKELGNEDNTCPNHVLISPLV